jgi:hypothetical protein
LLFTICLTIINILNFTNIMGEHKSLGTSVVNFPEKHLLIKMSKLDSTNVGFSGF